MPSRSAAEIGSTSYMLWCNTTSMRKMRFFIDFNAHLQTTQTAIYKQSYLPVVVVSGAKIKQ